MRHTFFMVERKAEAPKDPGPLLGYAWNLFGEGEAEAAVGDAQARRVVGRPFGG